MNMKTKLEEMLAEVIEWESKYYGKISTKLYCQILEYECEIRKELYFETFYK